MFQKIMFANYEILRWQICANGRLWYVLENCFALNSIKMQKKKKKNLTVPFICDVLSSFNRIKFLVYFDRLHTCMANWLIVVVRSWSLRQHNETTVAVWLPVFIYFINFCMCQYSGGISALRCSWSSSSAELYIFFFNQSNKTNNIIYYTLYEWKEKKMLKSPRRRRFVCIWIFPYNNFFRSFIIFFKRFDRHSLLN